MNFGIEKNNKTRLNEIIKNPFIKKFILFVIILLWGKGKVKWHNNSYLNKIIQKVPLISRQV